jgi:FemAB-related protein (PEP-CTERM system-associated)
VLSCPAASTYFLADWALLARDVFRHRVFFIEARGAKGRLCGVLPVVQQKGLLGNFATSIPFFNYGGALASDSSVRAALMDRARELAQHLGCAYLELRDVNPEASGWRVRTDKVSMILQLPSTTEELSKRLGSKLRSQVKRSEREAATVRTGGLELLGDFYRVFAANMRDLGTPVYPKRFFRAILGRFPTRTSILVIDHQGKASAAAFLVMDRDRAEIPWASCLAEAKPLGFNMKLYWEVLTFVISRGCTSFDFGRSTVDSGTYKFKKQWGAEPLQLHWYRWDRNAVPEAAGGMQDGSLMKRATAVWQRLPLPVANFLGPFISPGLPW